MFAFKLLLLVQRPEVLMSEFDLLETQAMICDAELNHRPVLSDLIGRPRKTSLYCREIAGLGRFDRVRRLGVSGTKEKLREFLDEHLALGGGIVECKTLQRRVRSKIQRGGRS